MMKPMLRAIVLATLVFAIPCVGRAQPVSILHIKVVVTDAQRRTMPVPEHALLISDNPSTSAPRRVVTGLDGTVDVRLRPGNYTVESDEPMAFEGKSYQWTQTLDVVAGRDAVLELTSANAEIGSAPAIDAASAHPGASLSSVLAQRQDAVVALWTPTAHASGFVIDANGLVVTSQRAIGAASALEVQVTPAVKVEGRLLAADAERDVAVIWIDPAAAPVAPVPLGCGQPEPAAGLVKAGQDVFTIGVPLRQQKGPAFGTVSRVDSHTFEAGFHLPSGSMGGPVFASDGALVGVTSDARVVRVKDVCDVVASAEKKMANAAPPSRTHLPVEPAQSLREDALKEAARRRVGSLNPYQISTSDFDVAFITPVEVVGALEGATRSRLMDFGNWWEYVADAPPVLLLRVTPKQVESFWTTVARGAASTQGASLPAIKHAKSGFSRMRVFCGDAEVTPIHPFRIEQRVDEREVISDGLYVFAPDALGPECAAVKLTLYSERDPSKGDTRVVDPKALQQIRRDFTP